MDTKKLHIGQIVENAFNHNNKHNLTKVAFSKAIGIKPQNLNRHFENSDWSVIKMISAGQALEHDFSYLFGNEKKKQELAKIFLQIEVKEDNVEDVVKIIENKHLYKILNC